jgi:hypothetical protein
LFASKESKGHASILLNSATILCLKSSLGYRQLETSSLTAWFALCREWGIRLCVDLFWGTTGGCAGVL